jgi:hypothetical protein
MYGSVQDEDGIVVVDGPVLRRACDEFRKLLERWAEAAAVAGARTREDHAFEEEAIAYEELAAAFQRLLALWASCADGFLAEVDVLFALKIWFPEHDWVKELTLKLLKELRVGFIVDLVKGSKKSTELGETMQTRLDIRRFFGSRD